jgi:hypothetical protein
MESKALGTVRVMRISSVRHRSESRDGQIESKDGEIRLRQSSGRPSRNQSPSSCVELVLTDSLYSPSFLDVTDELELLEIVRSEGMYTLGLADKKWIKSKPNSAVAYNSMRRAKFILNLDPSIWFSYGTFSIGTDVEDA